MLSEIPTTLSRGYPDVPSGLASSSGFDDNLLIEFTPLILPSPVVQTLDFLDKNKTPQSRPPQTGSTLEAANLMNQGHPLESKKE